MSKYFDGYASFDYKEMSKEKLIYELKEKIQYIGALKREITDLEKEHTSTKTQNKRVLEKLEMLVSANQELEKQLEEKETRIAELEDKDWYEGTIKQLEEQNERLIKERDDLEKILEDTTWTLNDKLNKIGKADQDKISFAIEQLEKVRNEIHGICFFTCDFKCDEIMLQKSDKIIDNQIKELKGAEIE